MIPLDEIDVGARLRPAGAAHVEALAASIARGADAGVGHEGLRSPVELRARPEGETGRPYVLISGYHRLKALILLERETAPAQILTADEAEAALLEIEENLVRADLTALDRALHVRRFRALFEAAYGAVAAGRPQKNNRGKLPQFPAEDGASENRANMAQLSGGDENTPNMGQFPVWSEAAKERLGLAGETLRRLLKIANGLDEVSVARLQPSSWADNQAFLLEFVGAPSDMRPDVLDLLLDPENELSLREALAKVGGRAPEEERPKDRVWLEKALNLVSFEKPAAWRREFYGAMIARDLNEVRAAAEAAGYSLTPKPIRGARSGGEG